MRLEATKRPRLNQVSDIFSTNQKKTEESFSENFEEAMNLLHAISPARGISMTFQREKENTIEQRNQFEPHATRRMETDTEKGHQKQ